MSGKLIEGVIYPDGWHYMQLWKGQNVRIDADTYRNLLIAVETWRIQNGANVGNVEAEVESALCAKHPRNCHGNPHVAGPLDQQPSIKQGFIDALISWGRRMVNSPLNRTTVNTEEALRRASICVRCPRNIRWENSCATCIGEAVRLFTVARGMKDLPNGEKLRGCAAYKFCCRSAVWIKKEALAGTTGDQPWHECWMGK